MVRPVPLVLLALVTVGYVASTRRIPARRSQTAAFGAGVLALAAALVWPLPDVERSVLAHYARHLLLLLVAPPLLLLSLPRPLVLRLTSPRPVDRTLMALTRPFVAAALFNVVVVVSHTAPVFDRLHRSPVAHGAAHAVLFAAAIVMWTPALRVLPGVRRMPPQARVGYLALQSIVPNVPASVLLFANAPLYPLHQATVLDQQLAGVLVKLVAVTILAGADAAIFFRWSSAERRGLDPDPLTVDDVERELARSRR